MGLLPPTAVPSSCLPFSLQGALQLKQDFDLVRDLLQSLPYGLSPETKRLVLALHIFQQMDNAVACLLQQPSKASLPLPNWLFCHKCCESRNWVWGGGGGEQSTRAN